MEVKAKVSEAMKAACLNVTADSVTNRWQKRKGYQLCSRSLKGPYLKSLRVELKTKPNRKRVRYRKQTYGYQRGKGGVGTDKLGGWD